MVFAFVVLFYTFLIFFRHKSIFTWLFRRFFNTSIIKYIRYVFVCVYVCVCASYLCLGLLYYVNEQNYTELLQSTLQWILIPPVYYRSYSCIYCSTFQYYYILIHTRSTGSEHFVNNERTTIKQQLLGHCFIIHIKEKKYRNNNNIRLKFRTSSLNGTRAGECDLDATVRSCDIGTHKAVEYTTLATVLQQACVSIIITRVCLCPRTRVNSLTYALTRVYSTSIVMYRSKLVFESKSHCSDAERWQNSWSIWN